MHAVPRLSLALLFVALAAGCSTNLKMYAGEQRPESELALLVPSAKTDSTTLGSTYASGGGAAVQTRTYSLIPKVYLKQVDGQEVAGAGNQAVEVTPGKHKLVLRLLAPHGFDTEEEWEVEVEAGQSYDIWVQPAGDNLKLFIKSMGRWKR